MFETWERKYAGFWINQDSGSGVNLLADGHNMTTASVQGKQTVCKWVMLSLWTPCLLRTSLLYTCHSCYLPNTAIALGSLNNTDGNAQRTPSTYCSITEFLLWSPWSEISDFYHSLIAPNQLQEVTTMLMVEPLSGRGNHWQNQNSRSH